MPPCDAIHLFNYLLDMGPALQGDMGARAIDEITLQAWQFNTGIELMPWESRVLKLLSFDYLAESRAAEKVDRLPPWRFVEQEKLVEDQIVEKETIGKRIRGIFRA